MSLLQEFEEIKKDIGEEKSKTIDEYCESHGDNLDFGKIVYNQVEWSKFNNWYNEHKLNRKVLILGNWENDEDCINCNAILVKDKIPIANIIDSFNKEMFQEKGSINNKQVLKSMIYDNFEKYENLPKLSKTSKMLQDIYIEVSTNESKMAFIDDDFWNTEFKDRYTDKDIECLKKEANRLKLEDVITFNQDNCKITAYSGILNKFNDNRHLRIDVKTYNKYQNREER